MNSRTSLLLLAVGLLSPAVAGAQSTEQPTPAGPAPVAPAGEPAAPDGGAAKVADEAKPKAAQDDEDEEEAKKKGEAAKAPPPAAPPSATPAAPPAAPAAPATTPERAPKAKAEPEPAKKKPDFVSRFAGSTFTWNHSATTTMVGVGRDNIGSEGDSYNWFFTLSPSFLLLREQDHQIRLSVSPTLGVELTNSDVTTEEREPQFLDTPIRATYVTTLYKSSAPAAAKAGGAAAARDPTLAGGGNLRTSGIVGLGANLPTSPASMASGRYLTTIATLGLRQQIKLLGSEAKGLNDITFSLTESWWHLFSRASTPTNEDLRIARQTAAGQTLFSDQLTAGALVQNTLVHSASFFVPLYGDLQLSSAFQLISQFPHEFEGQACEVQTLTGCVQADRQEDRTSYRVLTNFDVNLAFQVSPEFLFDVGYSNSFANQIGEDGRRRNVFYSPGATFYADAVFFLDSVYKRARGAEKKPAVGQRGR